MRLACCVLLCSLFNCSTVSAQEKVDPAKEMKQLEGTWKVASMEALGKPAPADKVPKQLEIGAGKLSGFGPDMEIRIDPNQKPKWIDLTFKKGNKSYPLKAIYDLDGDDLRLCIPLAQPGVAFENQRPDGFDTKEKALAVLRLKRAKK